MDFKPYGIEVPSDTPIPSDTEWALRSFAMLFGEHTPEPSFTRDELRGKVEVFLSAKKVTLWGDFDLSRQDRFDQAVEWLTDQIEGVLGAT